MRNPGEGGRNFSRIGAAADGFAPKTRGIVEALPTFGSTQAGMNTPQDRLASDDSGLLLGLIGLNLRMKALNPAWERLLGYPREQLLEKPLLKLVDRNEYAAVFKLVAQPLSNFSDKPVEFSVRCKDGAYRCFEWVRRPARTEQAIFISGRDVTERKKMETTDNLKRYLQAAKTGTD
jgi:PAS domain S-box-containing protein